MRDAIREIMKDAEKATTAELELALSIVIDDEDLFGRPDTRTEDYLRGLIAARKTARSAPVYFAQGAFADDDRNQG